MINRVCNADKVMSRSPVTFLQKLVILSWYCNTAVDRVYCCTDGNLFSFFLSVSLFARQTRSQCCLIISIFYEINKRINGAISKGHQSGKFGIRTIPIKSMTQVKHEIENPTVCPTDDKTDADNQKCFNCISFRQFELISLILILTCVQVRARTLW